MLKRFALALCILVGYGGVALAQQGGTLTARLTEEKTNQPLELATVTVVRLPDSAVVKRVASGKDGSITVSGLSNHNYKVTVGLIGYKTLVKTFSISARNLAVDLGTLILQPDVQLLKNVVVKGIKDPVAIKGDTTEFNAGSYKTQVNDNVEALLKKLPGVDVDKDGNITAQGKKVSKVLVDGKEFFGSDPKAATKNLPADAIEKVQVIDDKTDKTKNTGIDDGQREKVINVKLKADHKKGVFGNVTAEGGTDNRYLGQFNLNHFDNKKQVSLLFLSNNVNESGFSFEDLNNFTGNDVFGAFSSNDGSNSLSIDRSGRVNVNGAFSGVRDGLIKYNSGGINYSDVLGKKEQFKFNISLITLLTSNYLTQLTDIQDVPNSLLTHQNSISHNTQNSYRLNMNFNYKPDTLNNFILKPRLSLGYTGINANTRSYTTNLALDSINRISQFLDQSTHKPSYGGQATVNHKFQHGKGSVNVTATGNYSATNMDYTNQYRAVYYVAGQNSSNTNQQTAEDDHSTYLSGAASFIRELSHKSNLSFTLSQNYDYRKDNASQYTVDYNAVTGHYDIYDQLYSGNTDNRNWRYTTTAGLNKTGKVLTWNLNMGVTDLGLNGRYMFNGQSAPIERSNWAFVPNASLSYQFKNKGNLYISAGSSVQLPSATDLQPVFNNTNPLYIRQGNPDLAMSRTGYVSVNYNHYDPKTNSYTGFYGNFSQTWNGFSTASFTDVTDTTGITTTRPINTNGNYNATLGVNWGKPTKIKGLKFSLGTYINTSRTVNYINNNENAVFRFAPQLYGRVSYDSDVWQLSLSSADNYNVASNSYQHLADNHYFNYSNNADVSVKPVKSWRLFTNINQQLYRGQPASANTSFYIWNAGVERYLLARQNLTLSVNAFDLLNQNQGLRRTITNTGQIQNLQTNTIGRYVYFKIIYKILKFEDKNAKKGNNGIIIM